VARASEVVERYDWSNVTDQVLTVYETVLAGTAALGAVHDEGAAPSARSAAATGGTARGGLS